MAAQVTLPAKKIVEILQKESGLTLEVKRALVREAYKQGRLLNPRDLTDEILFQLVEQDENVRVIATHEIVDRAYVRAKPTLEELQNGDFESLMTTPEQDQQQSVDLNSGSQENQYWATRQQRQRQSTAPAPSMMPPVVQPPLQQGEPVPSQPSPSQAPSRQVNQAAFDRDIPEGSAASDQQQLSRIQPEELPALLRSSGGNRIGGSGRMRSDALSGMTNRIPASASNLPFSSSVADLSTLSQGQYDEESSTHYPRQPRVPRFAPEEDNLNTKIRHRPNPYADVPSLYDIYAQVSRRQPILERFGANIFQDESGNLDELPMDLPVGPDYMVGPGDGLNIDVWGGISERLVRTVDRQGRVALPEVGTVLLAGKTLGEAQQEVQAALRTQVRDIHADVSLAKLRTVRVYVVGDVAHPGAYDISSLSTPLNALYAARGPISNGSLRLVKHFRGKELVQQVDLYDLLLHGTRNNIKNIEPGDTILTPSAGPQVKVEGMVRRPAIYELNGETNLAELLELSGGVLPTGTLRHIEVQRIQAHTSRTMLSLDIPEGTQQQVEAALEGFKIQDGDEVRISPILPYSDETVYLDGHVFHPGKYPYHDRMKVTDLIKSYSDLLPEPYEKHAEIIRLTQPGFRPEVISFDLAKAMTDTDQDLSLQPFDTVRIFGRFDFEDPPVISVIGEVRDPGTHQTNGVPRLSDAIYLAGGLTPEAMLRDVQIFRYSQSGKVRVLSANLEQALAGDAASNITLQPRDRVLVHRSPAKLDPPSVTIEGEVAKPGRYPLGTSMTASELVRVAGGFKRGAYTEKADLSRYSVEKGTRVVGEQQEVAIAQAVAGDDESDVRLHDGDVLSIRQIAGWKDIGGAITVKGEVLHPGVYGIQEGEHLSSVLRRAGGFSSEAYPYGAVFERIQVQELAELRRQDLIHRIQSGSDIQVSSSVTGQEQAALLQASMQQQKQVLAALQDQKASGRMVIHISSKLSNWQNSINDIIVRPGDVISIPKQPNFVLINGQVYNPSAISFLPEKNVEWYLRQAGGPTELANTKHIFVIRADGSLIGQGSSGFWSGGVLTTKLRPGDTVVVPEKFVTGSSAMKTLLSTAQVLSQIAFTAAIAVR